MPGPPSRPAERDRENQAQHQQDARANQQNQSGTRACGAPARPPGNGSARARVSRPRRCCPAAPRCSRRGWPSKVPASGLAGARHRRACGAGRSRRSSCSTRGRGCRPRARASTSSTGRARCGRAASDLLAARSARLPACARRSSPRRCRRGRGARAGARSRSRSPEAVGRRVQAARRLRREPHDDLAAAVAEAADAPGKIVGEAAVAAGQRKLGQRASLEPGRPGEAAGCRGAGSACDRARGRAAGSACDGRGSSGAAAASAQAIRKKVDGGAHARPSLTERARATANSATASMANATRRCRRVNTRAAAAHWCRPRTAPTCAGRCPARPAARPRRPPAATSARAAGTARTGNTPAAARPTASACRCTAHRSSPARRPRAGRRPRDRPATPPRRNSTSATAPLAMRSG